MVLDPQPNHAKDFIYRDKILALYFITKNIIEYIILKVHDINIMTDQIGGSVWQFSEDAAIHLVMSPTKPPRFLLVR